MGTMYKYKSANLGSTETTETSLGDITVPSLATRITGISIVVSIEETTLKEGTSGWGRLNFSGAQDLEGIPIAIVGSGTTSTDGLAGFQPVFTPCNIDVSKIQNGTIACFVTLTKAQTATCNAVVSLRFE